MLFRQRGPGRKHPSGCWKTALATVPVVLCCLLAGCRPRGSPTASLPAIDARPLEQFTDGLGRQVAIPIPVERVISLAPSNTEILCAVGATHRLVGCDDSSDYPAHARSLPHLGSTGGKLDLERIVALKPDLILAAEINSAGQVKSLEGLGLRVFLISNPAGFKDLFDNVRFVGRIAGGDASRLVESLEARVAAVQEKMATVRKRPRVFYELDATDVTRPWTIGPGTFLNTLIDLAGGENLGAAFSHPFPRLSIEEILRQDPHVIVLGDAAAGVTVESVGARPGWSSLSAVKKGRVYPFDGSLGSRPGPRLVDGLEALSKILHPELFSR